MNSNQLNGKKLGIGSFLSKITPFLHSAQNKNFEEEKVFVQKAGSEKEDEDKPCSVTRERSHLELRLLLSSYRPTSCVE